MKKIIPFKKDLFLKSNVAEIVSISLEHTLNHKGDYLISGDFIITGEYKVTEASINTEQFEFKIPFDINVDEKYILDRVLIDIDDFYYEIVNNNLLSVNIEVLLDKLEEKERCIEEETMVENKEIIENVFNDIDSNNSDINESLKEKIFEENIEKLEIIEEKLEKAKEKITEAKTKINGYVTYRVCVLKEDDNVEKIMERYKVDRDALSQYNNLQDLKVGDKLIIPSNE